MRTLWIAILLVTTAARADKLCPLEVFVPPNVREIAFATPVQHQLIGSCSTHATANALSHFALDASGKPIALSVDYLLAHQVVSEIGGRFTSFASSKDWKRREAPSRTRMLTPNATGGNLDPKLRLANEFGMVPAAEWKPKIPVEKFIADGGLEKLFAPGTKWGKQLDALTEKFRKVEGSWHAEASIRAEFEQLLRDAMAEALEVSFTPTFRVDGRKYDPTTFQKTFLDAGGLEPEEFRIITTADANRSFPKGAPPFGSFTRNTYFDKALSMADVEKKLREAIDGNQPVLVALPVYEKQIQDGSLLDNKSGQPPRFNSGEPHAMQVVGYALGPDGTVTHWKIKNSWGTKSGHDGYFYITPGYVGAHDTVFEILRRKAPAPVPPPPRRGWWTTLFGR